MAKQIGARKCSKQQVICKSPSVNWTRIGKDTVPIPYSVQCHLAKSNEVSGDVFFNSNEAFTLSSDTNYVKGDARGSKKGIKSGTVSAEAEPIEHSSSVRCNCRWVVRCGDLFYMNAKNTVGNLTCSPAVSKPHITDSGKISGYNPASSSSPAAPEGSSIGMGASDTPGGLGALRGSPVLLQSAQAVHDVALMPLEGIVPIEPVLHYVSDRNYSGAFGRDRACSWEKRFASIGANRYRLTLPDGRGFLFEQDEQGGFRDIGNLGVRHIKQTDTHTFVLHYKDGTIETYRYSLLVTIEDIAHPNNALEISYLKHPMAGPCIAKVHNTQQSALKFIYDKEGLVQSLEDHTGALWRFEYENQVLQQIHYNDTVLEQYEYLYIGDTPLLHKVYDAQSQPRLKLAYDTQGRVVGYEENGVAYRYTYGKDREITKEDNNGKRHIFWLNEHGEIRTIVYPDGSVASQHYDASSRILYEDTQGGNQRETHFDASGRIVSTYFNEELIESYGYTGENPHPTSYTKGEHTTHYEYDEHQRLTRIIHPDKSTQQYSYTPEGLVSSYRDERDKESEFFYDARARLLKFSS
jgi:YD repeat-containing protein